MLLLILHTRHPARSIRNAIPDIVGTSPRRAPADGPLAPHRRVR